MIKLLCAKLLHALTYGIWLILPLLTIAVWSYNLTSLATEAIRSTIKEQQKLKDKVLLWYLKNSW